MKETEYARAMKDQAWVKTAISPRRPVRRVWSVRCLRSRTG